MCLVVEYLCNFVNISYLFHQMRFINLFYIVFDVVFFLSLSFSHSSSALLGLNLESIVSKFSKVKPCNFFRHNRT